MSLRLGVAQVSATSTLPVNLAFKHILPDQLETIGYLTAIVQDKQGFMWFGGANGLVRYDGYTLTLFKNEENVEGSLSDSYVNALTVTRDGTLWVATQAGLNRFNADTNTFTVFLHESDTTYGISVNDIRAILEDSKGRLWLGTRGGLNQFYRETGKLTRYYYDEYPAEGGNSIIWSLVEDRDGYVWIGHHTAGISRFNPEENTFLHFHHDPLDPNSISHNDVRTLLVDSANRVWAGTYGGGLNRLDQERKTFERLPFDPSNKSDTVWGVIEDDDGKLWVADGGAVNVLDGDTLQFSRFSHKEGDSYGLGNHVVSVVYEDRVGGIWIGFHPSGVDIVDRQASVFRNFVHNPNDPNSVSGGGVLATYEDLDGNLWIGAGYGLSFLNRRNETFTNYRHNPADPTGMAGDTVLSIAGDHDGYIWLGIFSAGLQRLDPKTGEFRRYLPNPNDPNSLQGKEPWGVIVDRDGVVWAATEMGLNRYNRETDDFTWFIPHPTQMDGDGTLYSRVVYEDSKRNLWLGSNRGLYLFNRTTEKFERFRQRAGMQNSLSTDFIKAIFEDSRGRLWLGTHGGGLNRMDVKSGRFTVFNEQQGLPDNNVSSIIEDRQQHLWVSTNKGLARFDEDRGTFQVYDKRHGLPGNIFNRDSASITRRGELVFGSSKGLSIFNPALLRSNDAIPPVVITDFQIFNKPVEIGPDSPLPQAPSKAQHISLTYKQSVFSFAFAALNYLSPEENLYAYKLEGFDKDWHYVDKKRTATYTNLDPGEYVFRVKGSNNEGVWNNAGVAVALTVSPPLWKTWWAYSLYVAALLAVFYFVLYFQLKKQAYEREHTLNQRLQDLDKLKDEFLANTSHELRTPLNGIIGLSESLLDGAAGPVPENMRNYLEMIAYSGKRLANLVNDILDFSKLKNHTLQLHKKPVAVQPFVEVLIKMTEPLIGGKELELINAVPEDLPPMFVDDSRMQQIVYNLLGNAIKFTDFGSVTVSAKLEGQMIVLDVVDTGIGIPEDQVSKIFESFEQVDGTNNRKYGGTGLGLAITKRLIELHGGTVSVSSSVGVGSRFRLRLPVATTADNASAF